MSELLVGPSIVKLGELQEQHNLTNFTTIPRTVDRFGAFDVLEI
jgi:hypothetical protein